MTFDASIPLNSDSPSVFPAQSQANFGRLQTLLGADHQFNLSSASDDGYHNLVHLTQQAPTGALSGYGRLYAKSVSSVVQLYYMDDAGNENQITPFYTNLPIKISGSQSIGAGVSVDILDVAYTWAGMGTVYISSTTSQSSWTFNRTGSSVVRNQLNTNAGGTTAPTIEQSGTKLQVKNNAGSAKNIGWSLIINRLS